MAYLENWPLGSTKNITVGNPEAELSIATLWTRHQEIASLLEPESYSVVGQLYEKYGISYLLRNLAANPHIRKLVVCGADLSGSGEALLQLWREGVTPEHTIIGVEKSPIQKEIPKDFIDQVRQNVDIVDFRRYKKEELATRLRQVAYFSDSQGPWGDPTTFLSSEVTLGSTLPSEVGAHIVKGSTIAETWLKVLREVMEYGEDAPTNYGNMARDLSNLVAVVTDEDPNQPYLPDYFNFTKEEVTSYVEEFTSPNLPDGLFYTYGERFLSHGPFNISEQQLFLDQQEVVLAKLAKDPNDRGALAVLYSLIKDNQLDREQKLADIRTSCIVSYQFSVKRGLLEMLAVFRSNDMYSAWPRNSFGLRSVQSRIAKQLGYDLGPLVTLSTRAHIYEDKWPMSRDLIQTELTTSRGFSVDPRGNLVISTDSETGQISFLQQSESGQPIRPILSFDGLRNRATFVTSNEIANRGLISEISHALDIGAETLKAEIALKTGLPYVQDSPDFLKEIISLIQDGQKYRQQGLS
jgi:thymidylate synthase